VPTSRHKSSSTNGLPATGPQCGSKFKKKFRKKNFFRLHYDQKNTLNPLVKSVFKSVHNHRRYLQFYDHHVCSVQYAATRRLQLRAWPILRTGLRPVQLFLVVRDNYSSLVFCCFRSATNACHGKRYFCINNCVRLRLYSDVCIFCCYRDRYGSVS